MPQLELLLIPTPGAKPEFLATLEPSNTKKWDLPSKIILEGYTRDAWAVKPEKGYFQTMLLKGIDKRRKVGGFLKYLKERQKAAYGRFGSGGHAVLVIGWVQPPSKDPTTPTLMVRYSMKVSEIPSCPLVVKKRTPPMQKAAPPSKPKPTSVAPKKSAGGGGLLGNLLGAQHRTNQHVLNAMPQGQKATSSTTSTRAETATTTVTNGNENGTTTTAMKTGQEVLAKFRQEMEQELLDFDISPEVVHKVSISLAEKTVGLEGDEKSKVTMEVLKYIVYEQADEVNEEWVAAKEASDFIDEAVISIYKEGHAPPEVLEDLNKGDLPDEVRGQQRAVQDAMRKQAETKQAKADAAVMNQAHSSQAVDDEDLATLNTVKRDRRTIEEIQRDRDHETKKQKTE